MNRIIASLLLSLPATLLLEGLFFFLTGKRNRRDLLLLVLVNILTNPAVVLLYWILEYKTFIPSVVSKAALEIGAVLVEGYYYRRYSTSIRRPYWFSLAANVFSFGTGVIISLFFRR